MPLIDPKLAYEAYLQLGTNSNHFVWFLSNVSFYKTSGDWIFAFQQLGEVILLPLEPLAPGAPLTYSQGEREGFLQAWHEFNKAYLSRVKAFVSIYEPFAALLDSIGFQVIKVGSEPWMDLNDCIPRGNAGKGVRAARNQALRAGIKVEEWPSAEVANDSEKRRILLNILEEWREKRILELSGFLNTVDPIAYSENRRYFIAVDAKGNAWAVLIATPVPGRNSYYLEDLITRAHCPRGVGELLTLETMVSLAESGIRHASLGVVSLIDVASEWRAKLPPVIEWLVLKLPLYLRKIYNVDGLETFRKRFKPSHWEGIQIAVLNQDPAGQSDTSAWFKALFALLRAFRPRVSLSWRQGFRILSRPWNRTPLTASMTCVSLILFAWVNRFGSIPHSILEKWGFSAAAPVHEWFLRSLVSDYLYFSPAHFVLCVISFLFVLRWAERSHSRTFLVPLFFSISLLDDFFNYIAIILPCSFFHPHLFEHLVSVKDVGGSLGLFTILGMQLCQIRKNREIIFAVLSILIVLGLIFSSNHITSLIVNLNHFLFLTSGYIVGKLRFEWLRRRSRDVCRLKPPKAKSVLQNSKRS